MKNTIIIAVMAAIVAVSTAFIKPPKRAIVSFHVSGNCKKCKNRIEDALDKPGVVKARWDIASQIVTITYNPRKLEEIQLHNMIASAGHDTEKVKASERAYADLPECCLYRTSPAHD